MMRARGPAPWVVMGFVVAGTLASPWSLQADEQPAEPVAEQPAEPVAEQPAEQAAPPTEGPTAQVVQDGMTVAVKYTLTVEGAVVGTSEGSEPLRYVHGRGELIPGLERKLAGMAVGEHKAVTVAPEDGYGPVDQEAFVDVSREQLPPGEPQVGQMVQGTRQDGQPFRARIQSVGPQTVRLDLNHPLAGKTLNFDVTILGISPGP